MESTDPTLAIPEAQVAAPLAYAPPERDPRRAVWVIVAGLATTVISLFGVWALEVFGDFNVMGLYANYVLPAGALIVGMAAGLGYGISSSLTGVKIRKGLLVTVILLQLGAYAGAKYVEFRAQGPLVTRVGNRRIGFFEYYHLRAVNFSWKSEIGSSSGKPGKPMGGLGYIFSILEIAGFVAGGIVAPAVMMARPYCDLCQMYMKRKSLVTIAASASKRKAPNSEHEAIAGAAQRVLQALIDAAKSGNAAAFNEQITPLRPNSKAAGKVPRRLEIGLDYCRNCHCGILRPTVVSGQGNQTNRQRLPEVTLEHAFVEQVVEAQKR